MKKYKVIILFIFIKLGLSSKEIDFGNSGLNLKINSGKITLPTKPTKPGGSESSGSFTWVFYILGGVGAIGGVFLIMKLRKRVRAA